MTKQDKRQTIVFCTDRRPRPLVWLKYALDSIWRCIGRNVRVVVCVDGEVEGIDNGVEVINVKSLIDKYGLNKVSVCSFHGDPVSPMMFFRLALPLVEELKEEDRIVYVDTDVEFESSKFMSIFEEDMTDYDVAGVQTCSNDPRVAWRNIKGIQEAGGFEDPLVPEASRKRMLEGKISLASGLLLMNLARMRVSHGDYGAYLSHMIDQYVKCRFAQNDESLLNLYLDCRTISASYNVWESVYGIGMPCYLRHYPGGRKVTKAFYPERVKYIPQDTVDIVYTVGKPSEHDDQELRWSLRSISKYGKNIGRVIVTSPVEREWLSDEVIQVDSQDIPNAGYKHHNILKSILDTIEVLDLHGEFLVSSDDHFYVKETDFARQPFAARHWTIPYNMGSSNNVHTMVWKTSCSDTRLFLQEHGLPTINFQMHRNAKWNADLVRDNKELFYEAMRLRFCVEPHLLMQNLWVSVQPDVPITYHKDAKIKEFRGTEGIDCLSCYNQTFLDDGFMEFMNREFGEKCRFEK